MTIEERMRRNDVEDQIYIGQLVEQHVRGEFGQVLKCIAEGIKEDKLLDSETNTQISSDRVLGVIVGLTALQSRLDSAVEIARGLVEDKKAGQEVSSDKPGQ